VEVKERRPKRSTLIRTAIPAPPYALKNQGSIHLHPICSSLHTLVHAARAQINFGSTFALEIHFRAARIQSKSMVPTAKHAA
jgi:hypothetical protein